MIETPQGTMTADQFRQMPDAEKPPARVTDANGQEHKVKGAEAELSDGLVILLLHPHDVMPVRPEQLLDVS